MRKFCIQSKAGVICGIYEGDTPTAAFEAMVADVGDGYDVDGRRTAGTVDDWIVVEIMDVTHDIVESDPSRDYEEFVDDL
jgi:hypothetical protein